MQNKSVKEVLELMLDYQEDFDSVFGGLCSWVQISYARKRISFEEAQFVLSYIRASRPSKFSSINAYGYRNRAYFWTPGKIQPRIKWIEEHIKKLSND